MADYNSEPFERKEEDKLALKAMLEDRRVVQMVRSFMAKSKEYREPHLDLAKASRDLYENWQAAGRSPIQRANLKLPFGFTIIESELPQLLDVFIKDENILFFEGAEQDDAQWENDITDFHNWQLREMDFEAKFPACLKSMLLDGTLVAKIPYRFKESDIIRRRKSIDPTTGEFKIEKLRVKEVTFDGPDLENVALHDFFPDWSMRNPGDIQGMRACVHRMYRTFASLKSSGIKYKNLDLLERSLSSKGCDAWAGPYWSDEHKDSYDKANDNKERLKDSGKIELWEYWGLYDPKGDGNFQEYLIVVANGDVVVRVEENFYDYKFKPFVACPNYVRDGEFYGIPELIAIRSLIKEANALRNARLDNVNISVNPMWLADRAAGLNSRSIYSRPNGIIWTNDINGIKPVQMPDPSIGSANELIQINQDIQGATALVAGAQSLGSLGKTFGRSATGVQYLQQSSSSRLGLKAKLLSTYFFKRMGWIMQMTNRQYVTEDQWVRVSDPNSQNPFSQLPQDAFFRHYDFLVKTDLEMGGPEAQFQKMQAVSQILQVAEQSQPGTVKFDVLLESMLRPLVGRQVKRFVRDEQERMSLQQQGLAAQQAVNAQFGQNAPQPNASEAGSSNFFEGV